MKASEHTPEEPSVPPQKRAVLMLCAHEPTMDPRVKWTAEFAARHFDVTVLGFNREDLSNSPAEEIDGYHVERIRRVDMEPREYFDHLKEAVPKYIRGLAVVLWQLVLLARAVSAGTLLPGRWIAQRIPWRLEPRRAQSAGNTDEASEFARQMRRLSTRAQYVTGLLRMQFSPATSIFWTFIREMERKPDVVHCNDLDTLLVGVLAKRHYGSRLVYDAHEYYPYCDPYGRWLDVKFFALLEWLLLQHVDGAVTVNPPLAKIMSKAYGRPCIYSVPNAEPNSDGALRPRISTMTELAAGRVKCLFQGRYSPKRGTEEIILGWQHVDPAKSALFLRGPNNVYTDAAKELAKSLGLLDRSVYFLDPVTEDLLVPAAAEADIGIVPYLPEFLIYQFSCPNKLSQYMHAGLMILTNDLHYVRSVVEEAEAGLVYNSSRPESLGEAVNRVANDPELLARFKANSSRYAHQTFNWQAYAGVFEALYRGQEPEVAVAHRRESPPQTQTGLGRAGVLLER